MVYCHRKIDESFFHISTIKLGLLFNPISGPYKYNLYTCLQVINNDTFHASFCYCRDI